MHPSFTRQMMEEMAQDKMCRMCIILPTGRGCEKKANRANACYFNGGAPYSFGGLHNTLAESGRDYLGRLLNLSKRFVLRLRGHKEEET